MCTNKIYQTVPSGLDYKEVEGVCGQTGIHGRSVYCEECEKQGASKRDAERERMLKYYDY